jgi:hypothetical protein
VLIFRGTPTHLLRRSDLIAARALEEAKYSKYCRVMWQKCSWADTETMVRWAQVELKEFLQDMGIEDCILLADNLNAQCAQGFKRACKDAGARVWLGPKNATHVWQPADHHVGAAYKQKMGAMYDDFMVDFDMGGKLSVGDIRVLRTIWAGNTWVELEHARREREEGMARNPDAKPSLFYSSFLTTGNLVTRDGLHDDKIKPNKGIIDDLETVFRGLLNKAGPSPLSSVTATRVMTLTTKASTILMQRCLGRSRSSRALSSSYRTARVTIRRTWTTSGSRRRTWTTRSPTVSELT